MIDSKVPLSRTYSKDVIKYTNKSVHSSTTYNSRKNKPYMSINRGLFICTKEYSTAIKINMNICFAK